MKNKLLFLTKVSLNRKIKTKTFLIVNIVLALVLMAVMNIDTIIKAFGGDFDELTKVYVIDETNYTYDMLKNQIDTTTKAISDNPLYEVLKYDKTLEDAKKEIEENDKIYAIEVKEGENYLDFKLVSGGYIDTLNYQILYQAINSTKVNIAMSLSSIDMEELAKIEQPVELERIILDQDKKSESESTETIMSTVFPIVILPFFMLTIFLIQMVGMEVNDEKTTRGMEIIISNVSPKAHFFSKIIAGNVFIISQSLLLIIYGALGLLLRELLGSGNILDAFGSGVGSVVGDIFTTDFFSKLTYIIPLTLVLMLLTFLAYSLLSGILASMTTNAEDFSQLQTPMMIVLLIGYYLAIMAGMFKGALFIRILSYVPLISAILSPSLLVLNQIGIVDVLISIGLLIVFVWLLIKYGLKIYKVGILNYSSKDLWKKMFKAIKE